MDHTERWQEKASDFNTTAVITELTDKFKELFSWMHNFK